MTQLKTILLSLLTLLMLGACEDRPQKAVTIDFNSGWEFAQADSMVWRDAIVPGSVQQDLIRHGLIKDPRIDTAEFAATWVEQSDWIYRKRFKKSELPDRHYYAFDFQGLDTYALILLNGDTIGVSNNAFVQKRTWADNETFQEENDLLIYFKSTLEEGSLLMAGRPHGETAGNDTGTPRISPFVRKAPYQFGWDWGPRVLSMGIRGSIRITATNAPVQSNFYANYSTDSDNRIKGEIIVPYFCQEKSYDLTVKGPFGTLRDSAHVSTCPISAGLNFSLSEDLLWTPSSPQLHDITVEFSRHGSTVYSQTKRTGFSNIQLHQEEDSIGTSFYFSINGTPTFIRGANYIPQSMFPAEVTDADYRRLLTQVKESNINMLRVWGGGIYERDIFYDLCDSLGIMVWQDFMFAGAMYPSDKEFKWNAEEEARYQVERLRHHPCIVMWCGNNEVDVAWKNWGWKEILGTDSAQAEESYNELFNYSLRYSTPQASNYIHSSPLSNWGTAENFNHHNMHYWGVWHGSDSFNGFEENVPRFMSEYGFQSFPMPETFEGQVPAENLGLDDPLILHRQKSYKGTQELSRHMEMHYEVPTDFKRYCYVSQLNQALAMEMAINAHRFSNGHCMGTMYWQLNDVWAGPTWSTIDAAGNWKAAHYRVKNRYSEIVIATKELEDGLEIMLDNQSTEDFQGTLIVDHSHTHVNPVMNSLHKDQYSHVSEVEINVSKNEQLSLKDPLRLEKMYFPKFGKNSFYIHFSLQNKDGESINEWTHYFVKPKDLSLPEVSQEDIVLLSHGDGHYSVSSSSFVKDLYLSSPDVEGEVWSDNFFDLLPNQVKEIQLLTPHEDGIRLELMGLNVQ